MTSNINTKSNQSYTLHHVTTMYRSHYHWTSIHKLFWMETADLLT